MKEFLSIALPKGRLGENAYKLFADAGYGCPSLLEPGRKLIFENEENGVCFFWAKPSDVAVYVENGAADIGVVIDEAYVDFGAESAVGLTEKYENLIVVQTYSKSRSLAGARLGFAIASEGLISDMNRIKYSLNPYNINRLTLLAGEASIGDDEYFKTTTEKIVRNREYTASELRKRGFYVTDSKANFLFAKTDAVGGKELYLGLKKCGVLVRHFDKEKINDFVRISIGTREQTDVLLKKTDEILKEATNG